MVHRFMFVLTTSALAAVAAHPALAEGEGACCASGVRINEIRVTHGGTQVNEYFELRGEPGTSLACMHYVVLGPGGVIEELVGLDGLVIDASGVLLVAQPTFDAGAFPGAPVPDLSTPLNFIDGGNRTHLLCCACGGLPGIDEGSDLDQDDDGELDVVAWACVVDCIALVESAAGPPVYCGVSRGPTAGGTAPPHVYRCRIPPTMFSPWRIGIPPLPPGGGADTPDLVNPTCPPSASFAGLPHEAMGAADLAGGGGSLTVTNIGASGQDGVAILLGSADFACVSFALPEAVVGGACAADADSAVSLEWFDNTNALAASMSFTCAAEGTAVSATRSGGTTFTVQAYSGDVLVAQFGSVDLSEADALVVKPGGPIIITGDPHRPVPWPPDETGGPFAAGGLTIEFSAPVELAVNGFEGAVGEGPAVDSIGLIRTLPDPLQPLGRIDVLGRDIGSLTLTGEALGVHGLPHEIVGMALMQGIDLGIDNSVLIDKTSTLPEAKFGTGFEVGHDPETPGGIIGVEVRPGFLEDAAAGSTVDADIAMRFDDVLFLLGGMSIERGQSQAEISLSADFSMLADTVTGPAVLRYSNDGAMVGLAPLPGLMVDPMAIAASFDAWLFRILVEPNEPFGDLVSVRFQSLMDFPSPFGPADEIAIDVPVMPLNPQMTSDANLRVQTLGGGALSRFAIIDQSLILSEFLPADLNGDGVVDGADLGSLLAAWGPCGPVCPPCEGDINGDCAVDGADLGELLASWS